MGKHNTGDSHLNKNDEKKHLEEKESTQKEKKEPEQTQENKAEQKEENKELELLKAELEKTKDALLRKAAEFENYKRRVENEISEYIKYASENLIKELLPVLDDIDRSIESIEKGETKDFETLKAGVLTIFDKFKKILQKEGLKEIDCLGKEFDVNTCDALLQIPKPDVKPHTVIEVAEKGYILKDKIIRHAKVIVSSDDTGNQNQQ
ncbi:MAG: nucleotide exchange factor GrpE [Ignavibacteria bacterium]|nr:nucleotide exchange factor GrpE [Ignavibacteria bacterium]